MTGEEIERLEVGTVLAGRILDVEELVVLTTSGNGHKVLQQPNWKRKGMGTLDNACVLSFGVFLMLPTEQLRLPTANDLLTLKGP